MANDIPMKSVSIASGYVAAFSAEPLPTLESPYQAYREIADGGHAPECDSLEQLKLNIEELEDLHARLKFMMTEISGLLKQA
jgi:hypothetical protein